MQKTLKRDTDKRQRSWSWVWVMMGMSAFILGLVDQTSAITGCSAATNIVPPQDLQTTELSIECVTSPCNPGLCNWNGTSFTQCGPLTTCMLSGEDPPITEEVWKNETLSGFQGMGSTLISGKCSPPLSPQYYLYCPGIGFAPPTGSGDFDSGSY